MIMEVYGHNAATIYTGGNYKANRNEKSEIFQEVRTS